MQGPRAPYVKLVTYRGREYVTWLVLTGTFAGTALAHGWVAVVEREAWAGVLAGSLLVASGGCGLKARAERRLGQSRLSLHQLVRPTVRTRKPAKARCPGGLSATTRSRPRRGHRTASERVPRAPRR